MACRHIRFEGDPGRECEWIPMGLRESRCLLRSSNPRKWTEELARLGFEVDEADLSCLHNLTARWTECPLYVERTPADANRVAPADWNEFGYPLRI